MLDDKCINLFFYFSNAVIMAVLKNKTCSISNIVNKLFSIALYKFALRAYLHSDISERLKNG